MTSSSCQELVQALIKSGKTPAELAELLDNRVSARTIYRWSKGESKPQQQGDLVALEKLASSLLPADVFMLLDEIKESC